ncbi:MULTISPECIES: ABC transporter ATP-binding protein [Bacillales]|uniref:ABC transporter ATP-binding protein n=1 Tax=Bacillales TaxID=1385 RepID=UPI000E19E3A3|nr:ABC transporter ATP-binding protein [Parageobacillus thermoglucosidasius]RDE35057.1 ABC transporter ATP-binding protein [Parageobacillus thermoglucosidasius]BDG33669.1 multidrug ABC transporter ATP-binding protein [Parageobacillus thermoglucosidasius]GMO01436.1 ABC transporter ATP-binding protein [Parageobacillus thermoglucosidasius]
MIIEVEDLVVEYKGVQVVDHVSFSVEEGEIFGMIGPNGAGKTTTIECIEGIRENYSGSIRVLGLNPKVDRKKLYNLIGVQLQETSYQDKIKVWEICKMFSSFYANPLPYESLLNDFGLYDKVNSYVSKLSGGQRQKLAIILALIANPKIIFLDELSTGLDPQARRSMWELIKGLQKDGKTIYMTTHFMDEAEYLCNRIAIMDKGKVVAVDTVENLIKRFGLEETVVFKADELNLDEIERIAGVTSLERRGSEVCVKGREINFVNNILNYLGNNQIRYRDLKVIQPSLEDVFLKITAEKSEGM